jgi:histidinol-phosphate/aromatic aminotransferase/cobyric acid decarboxylase-like protein
MTFRLHEALSEMKRVSKGPIVCVEPVYEYGNTAQRLYNIVNDQCRTLLQDMRSCELVVEEQGLLSVLHNPLNPVGVVVARKAA